MVNCLECNSKPVIYLRVSTLSHVEICSKRAKSETFSVSRGTIKYKRGSALDIGKRLHRQYGFYQIDYSSDFKSMLREEERQRLKDNLASYKVNGAFQKVLELPEVTVVVRGDFDDLRLLESKIGKIVSFIEVKTTGKKYMWSLEVQAAIRQLQIYLWMLKELCEELGYSLNKHHFLEVFSQRTGERLNRIPVEYDEHIEEWITLAVYKLIGLAPMNIAHYKYCIICPKTVKLDCAYYQGRRMIPNV